MRHGGSSVSNKHVDATAVRHQWEMLHVGPYEVPEVLASAQLPLPPRVRQMIRILLANADMICHHAIGTVELHYHGESVKRKIKHPLTSA